MLTYTPSVNTPPTRATAPSVALMLSPTLCVYMGGSGWGWGCPIHYVTSTIVLLMPALPNIVPRRQKTQKGFGAMDPLPQHGHMLVCCSWCRMEVVLDAGEVLL